MVKNMWSDIPNPPYMSSLRVDGQFFYDPIEENKLDGACIANGEDEECDVLVGKKGVRGSAVG